MLATADQYGVVDKHPRAIAEETGLSREAVDAAILNLESPDTESRSPEHNGCRIIRMDEHRIWGWNIVNYGKYRAIKNEDDRREANRIAQEKFRNKSKQPSSSVIESNHSKPKQKQKHIQKEESKPLSVLAEPDVILSQVKRVWDYYIRVFKRKDSLYKFTDKRKAKGLSRYMDCLKLAVGNQEQASLLMKQAVDSLHASEYHISGGYYDWIDNLFKSTEQLQKWLDKPKVKVNGHSKQDERTQKNRETITAVLSEIAGRDGAVPQDGDTRGDDKGHGRRPQPVLGSGDP